MKITVYLVGVLLLGVSVCASADALKPEPKSGNSQEGDWLYTVNKNDSFELIYRNYLNRRANIVALSQYNHHKLTKKIQPGQVISIPVEMLKQIPAPVQVITAYGDVVVTSQSSGDKPSDKRKVNKGDSLAQGDSLQTGKNSLAKLLFADGSITDVQSNSTLSIQTSFKYIGKETYVTRLKLAQGRTDTAANPSHVVGNTMQVETPSAIAAVRGTQFRVGADGNIALQETLDGEVAFSASGQEVLLAKGYGSLAEKGKAPLPPILLPDAPDVSVLPKLIESSHIEFDLLPQQGIVTWVSQLALDAGFAQILNEQTIQSSKLSLTDLVDGQYYLKLRAQDSHGLQGKDAVHVFNVKVRPPEPVVVPEPVPVFELVEPLNDAVIPLAPTEFSWTPVAEANGYIIQIARDINFEDQLIERHASMSRLTLNQSFGSGEYYWRVGVLSQGQIQKFSEVRKFTR